MEVSGSLFYRECAKTGPLGHRLTSDNCRKARIPHIKIQNMEEILDDNMTLVGQAANQTPIPFSGWVELKFNLGLQVGQQSELVVSVLVSNDPGVAEPPIIGYKVIENIIRDVMREQPEVNPTVVREAFSVDCKRAEVLIGIVQSSEQNGKDGVVKVGKLHSVIPAGQSKEIKCSVRTGPLTTRQEVLFEPEEILHWLNVVTISVTLISRLNEKWSRVIIPVTNNNTYDVSLTPRTVLGHLQQVRTVYPADLRPAKTSEDITTNGTVDESGSNMSFGQRRKDICSHDLWDPLVSVDHLNPEQQQKVREMPREECAPFS